MARKPRVASGGMVYHVLNRSAGKMKVLAQYNFQAFKKLLIQAHALHPVASSPIA